MAGDEGSRFSDLPDDLLAQISSGSHGFPLLALSRRGRDAVLERARTIKLNVEATLGDLPPVARLLDRACRAAKPGLHLTIHKHKFAYVAHGSLESPLLANLLQRGLDAGGWDNVHALSVMVREQACLKQLTSHLLRETRAGVFWCAAA
jgi:hypothetical protein